MTPDSRPPVAAEGRRQADIVERLRQAAFDPACYGQWMLDAADEVERLRNAVAIAGEEIDAHINEIKRLHAKGEKAALAFATRREQLFDENDRLREALFWCGNSEDFSPGGKAREGWLKLCAPLLEKTPLNAKTRTP